MIEAKIILNVETNEDFVEELKQIVDHKIDALLNLDEFPEITDVYGCTMEITE